MNPKILHRLWIGPLEMPEVYQEYGKRWQELNPDWEIRLWSEQDVEDMGLYNRDVWDFVKLNGAVADTLRNKDAARATQMADVAAYEIVYNYGGVYTNCDMEPLRSLDALPVDGSEAWAVQELGQFVNNGTLGGPVKHKFWKAVIGQLRESFFSQWNSPMNVTTGPHLLTRVAAETSGLKVLPRYLFNLAGYEDVPVGGDASSFKEEAVRLGAIALHNWGHRSLAMR